ncbi:MAG: DUF2269 domain-containing protein [Dehalococcoidia bacterium]|nr:DUF2269 domain-containing protein [Dehalococcoidia bacterium]HRC63159.1 DUF2269 family protein [Dehalococcoidia bacterium]
MDGYDVLKFLHVYSVVLWVGGGALLNIMGTRLARAGTSQQLAEFGAQVEWIGLHIFTPLSVFALIMGILMALNDRWDFGQTWIQLGLGGWFLSFLLGAGFLGPQSGKLGRLVREHGPDHPEVRPRLTRLLLVARLDVVLMLLIVADMTIKPGL